MDGSSEDPESECKNIWLFVANELVTSGGNGHAASLRLEFFENIPRILDDLFGEENRMGWLENPSASSYAASSSSASLSLSASSSSSRRGASSWDRPYMVRLLSALPEEEGSLFNAIVFKVDQTDMDLIWKVNNLPKYSIQEVYDACELQRWQQPPRLYEQLFRPLLSQRRNVLDDRLSLSPCEYLLFCFFFHPVLAGRRGYRIVPSPQAGEGWCEGVTKGQHPKIPPSACGGVIHSRF